MNYRLVLNQFGSLLAILGLVMLAIDLLALVIIRWFGPDADMVRSEALQALVLAGLSGMLVGLTIWFATRRSSRVLGRREALLLVAMSWILGAAFCAAPLILWAHLADLADHPFRSFINCYFEAMSGLTTTGATVLGGDHPIVDVPRSLLLWRAFTQWIGGIGIVVLFVAVLPSLGVSGKKLYRVEAPGPNKEGLQPQIRETARVLFLIYLGLTAAQIGALYATGMSFFDSICHTFTTLATGGFSTRDSSMGGFPLGAQIVTIAFMVLAGMNFGLFYRLRRGRLRDVAGDVEFRFYVGILLVGSLLVFIALLRHRVTMTTGETLPPSTTTALAESVFTTASIQTTTGFCTSDFDDWPFLAHAVLITLMFIGGCAGSTAGGIKVIRVWIALKVMIAEIERVFRPHVIRPVRVGGGQIDPDVKLAVLAYVLGIVVLFAAGSAAVMLLEQNNPNGPCDFRTAATASVASLCTIGPGLGAVGPVENFEALTSTSKVVLCTLMALGRLEVFAIIVLFTPRFWRAN